MDVWHTLARALAPGEAFLVESPANRFYLTGFAAEDGFVLITGDDCVFYTDSRYVEKAEQTVTVCPVALSVRPAQEVRDFCQQHGVSTLYVEPAATSMRRFRFWQESLPGVTVSPEDRPERLLTDRRQVKTPREREWIRQAQAITDETFSYILPRIEAGRTEREIMLDMEFFLRRAGSEGVSFDFIVVSGQNSSLPHGVPTDKPLAAGDFVTMDFGAVVNGYRSDMTRTVAVSSADEEMRRVYETVLRAQTDALAAVVPGACCRDVDAVARRMLDTAYPGCFGHGLGHGVGIEIHESPSFSPRCDTVLRPGMVMTVEPGVYCKGRFGVRIEDMVFVTDTGAENITKSPKELLIL